MAVRAYVAQRLQGEKKTASAGSCQGSPLGHLRQGQARIVPPESSQDRKGTVDGPHELSARLSLYVQWQCSFSVCSFNEQDNHQENGPCSPALGSH